MKLQLIILLYSPGLDWGSIGTSAAKDTISDIMSTGMGLALEGHNDRRQLRQQQKLQDMQIAGDKALTDYNTQKQLELWNATNYSAQMEQLSKAGLNPGLLYGKGGAGGTISNIQQGSVGGGEAPKGGGEILALRGMGIQQQIAQAQVKVLESQANLNNVKAGNEGKGGVVNENIKADTANKVLQQVIYDYTGREAKDQYTEVRQPNRSIEADTYQTELEARKGVAGNIYELWTEGKLKEKSTAEIESLLIQNAKTKAEEKQIYKTMDLIEQNIKGAKLDNIIKDLEAKLQTETGIDRNAPTWLKMLGRLFVEITTK